tara:strand:+ start:1325 stop:2041 length:717 start_codon:yes stop_codon:yes gene_type:complete
MFDINLINKPGIQDDLKTETEYKNISNKPVIKKNNSKEIPENVVESNTTFKWSVVFILLCFLGFGIYYYVKFIDTQIINIYSNKDFNQTELFFQLENNLENMKITSIETNNINFMLNMDTDSKENFYIAMDSLTFYLESQVKGYHIDNKFSVNVTADWNISKSNTLNLNLFDKELSDLNFNIKKELYKDKLIMISDVKTMIKILQLIDELNLINRFFINIKLIDSIPNNLSLYQIIIS